MKKSKIIAPAAAILVFSSAAAVTGTVAWFTANRIVTASVSNIQAINTQGGLKAYITTGVNSKNANPNLKANAAESIAVEAGFLRDASYDMANEQLYYGTGVDESGNTNIFKATENTKVTVKKDANDVDVYFATTFTINFVLDGSADQNYDIFFSYTNSTLSASDKIAPAFRVAFDKKVVWAPAATTTTVSYVSDVDETSNYTTANLVTKGGADTTTANTAEQAAENIARLATGVVGGGEQAVKVTMWFEGTDASCKTANIPEEAYSASMKFYAINTADYAA